MYSTGGFGGLEVVWDASDEKSVDARLKELDSRLFLDKDRAEDGRIFYSAKFWNGERAPVPVTPIVDWRDSTGSPRTLSMGIVYEVERQMRRGPLSLRTVEERNKAKHERAVEELMEQGEELAKDFERHPFGWAIPHPRKFGRGAS